jgi:hypothetical protein
MTRADVAFPILAFLKGIYEVNARPPGCNRRRCPTGRRGVVVQGLQPQKNSGRYLGFLTA